MPNSRILLLPFFLWLVTEASAQTSLSGRVTDPETQIVVGATVKLLPPGTATQTDSSGVYTFKSVKPGRCQIEVSSAGLRPVVVTVNISENQANVANLQFDKLQSLSQSIVITAAAVVEPTVDLRNSEAFARALFSRDDQVFQQLNAGINAGQHEGGGKSLEIRRFGFNLDHGGVNGGLKVLVDNVQQNQGSQGHGQGYLGSLKSLSPELIQEVAIINGPFSAEYGDFSGLGVVHIRQRESLPDQFIARLQGGNFDTGRTFLGFSPAAQAVDSYVAYEGSYTNGPFVSPGRYRRDNVNANYTRSLSETQKIGFRLLFGRNNFDSSGQIPLDLVTAGLLPRFGFIDPTNGGRVKLGNVSAYYSKSFANGDALKIDGFVGRSLFDLYSNFTFFLNDPLNGDAFQQHDSRLQNGANLQYAHPHRFRGVTASFVSGANFHDNQINVDLYPRIGRAPTGVTTRANAHVTNEAGYLQESLSFFNGRLILGGGLRFDEFRYNVADRINPALGGLQYAGRWQGKGNLAVKPIQKLPFILTLNYGRGINSIDARGVVQQPQRPRLASTDFYQTGISFNHGRFGVSTDAFLVDHSNEQVYIPDDGSFEFKGASRAYGYEAKTSVQLTHHISLNGGLTKIANAFYRGVDHRVYVDSAPHFVANAALTVADWHGWSSSVRLRAINHYRLDGEDPSIGASGLTLLDLGISKRLNHTVDLNLGLDNLLNRDYYETQNYFESRVSPTAPVIARIHGTPGYPLSAIVGITLHLARK
jgi:outer membrane receptor protein involved in Fe transport